MARWFSYSVLVVIAFAGVVAPIRADTSSELEGALRVLERFMMAGKEGNALHGARLLDVYESSPKKTQKDIGVFFEKKSDLFESYEAIGGDLYGYEYIERGHKGPNVKIEGRVQTVDGRLVEFSALLVLRDQRWRILSFEID